MPCLSPNKVFYVGINPETGKKKILYTSRKYDYVYRKSPADKFILATGNGSNLFHSKGYQVITDSDLVPCGQCIGCRIDRAQQWAGRMMCEAKQYPLDQLYFVTLTYDDEHLPTPHEIVKKETGEIVYSEFRSLNKSDLQKFLKRLRKNSGQKFRYFASGEYGSKSYRPHYHIIFFGLRIDDLFPVSKNQYGHIYYKSHFIEDTWKAGKVIIGKVDYESCRYVAKYCLKKLTGKASTFYDDIGVIPEFCTMSRKPGIGKEYFEEHYEDIYKTDSLVLSSSQGLFKIRVPRYFDSLYERIDPSRLESIKDFRRDCQETNQVTFERLNPFIDEDDYLETKSRILEDSHIVMMKGGIL